MRNSSDEIVHGGETSRLGRLWDRLTTNRYTRHLEAEIERLRADPDEARRQVWALINSLVTTAGAPLPQEILQRAGVERPGTEQKEKQAVNRGRKSWHQKAMARELESARELRRIFARRSEAIAAQEGASSGNQAEA